MRLPTWLLFVFMVGVSVLCLASSREDASNHWRRTSSSEPLECRLRRQEELITCRGVNTTQLVESLTRMREQVAEGRQLGEKPREGENDRTLAPARGTDGSPTVREVSYFSCHLPKVTAASLLTPSSLEIVSVISSGVEEVQLEAFNAHIHTLTRLDLSHNLMKTLPNAVVNLTRLEVLDLRYNEIDHLPEGTKLFNLHRLRQLHLDHNKLGQIRGMQERLGYRSSGLSLAVFNLEPLRDSLTHLTLGHNAISAFPEQFSRPFTRLTNLDISSNHISEVLEGGFSEMPRLQYLDLSGNLLHSFSLRGLEASLLDLNLRGNPWTCTCDSKWILKSLQRNASVATPTVTTPTCSTPLHLRHRDLTSLTELDLCPPEVASSDDRVVFVGDEGDGPLRKALDSLHLLNVTALNHKALIVSWRIDAEFYSPSGPPTETLSWAVIFREMLEDPRSATVTRMNLERYKEERPDWQPRDSIFTELLHGLEPETQYVLCLTPTQDHHLFVRPDKCRYVSTLGRTFHTTTTTTTAPATEVPRIMPFVSTESYSAETERVSMERESRRVILSWNVTIYPQETPNSPTKREAILLRPLGWRITFRRFGEENETEVVLVSRGGEPVQNFTNHYSVEGLEPGTGYTFCFHSLTEQEVSESLAGSTREVRDMIPQANFQVSQGRSLQIHADHQPTNANSKNDFASFPAGGAKLPLGVTTDREVRKEGTNPGLAQDGSRPAVLTEESGQTLPSHGTGRSFSPNVPPVPNFPSQGKNSGFPENIPTVPNFPSPPRRPPRPQAGGNFVYTSTGERIPLPSTSSGFGPFRMPSIVGPIVNIGSNDPLSSPSTPRSPRNSKQRYIYEFDDSSSEKPPKQSFTYESTTEASNTTTPARQIYTYETRRKRSVEENENTRYSKILQTGAIQYCQEIMTLDENDIITPVAIASTVSSSTTMVVVLIFCCCCPKRCRRKKSGWSGRPSYTTRKVSTISAPTPVNVFSGHSSIITGSVIGESNGNLKNALPPRGTTSTTAGGTTHLEREANGNLVKTGRSVSVTSSAGYLTPMQMPNGVVHDPDQVFGDAQLRQRPDLSTLKDRLLQQHKDLKDFHPGYDIPPTSSNKTLFGYDYPHPSPVNPIGAHSNHTGRTDNLSTMPVPSHSTRDPNHAASSIDSGRDPETQQQEVNLNIPFAQNKSSGLNKSVELSKNPALNRSVDYNYIAPEDIDSKPRTYVKNATARNRHRKFGFPHRTGEEHLTLDAPSGPESQDYNDHPLSNGELSSSAPDLVNVGGSPASSEALQPSETKAPARLNLLIGNQTTNSLPRLSREEHGGTTSLPPEQTPSHAPAEVNCYTNLPVSQGSGGKRDEQEPRMNKSRDMYHTWTSPRFNPKKTRPSMGEVVLTGGTLIEVPDGYVVPKPPKPARPVTLLTQGEEKVEDSKSKPENPPEIIPTLAPQEDNKPVRRLPPLVIPNDSEREKSKITHLITPEMESNRIIISTGMPV